MRGESGGLSQGGVVRAAARGKVRGVRVSYRISYTVYRNLGVRVRGLESGGTVTGGRGEGSQRGWEGSQGG